MDGNFHENRYAKNTDPNDISLANGKAFFPDSKEFKEYLDNAVAPQEVSLC